MAKTFYVRQPSRASVELITEFTRNVYSYILWYARSGRQQWVGECWEASCLNVQVYIYICIHSYYRTSWGLLATWRVYRKAKLWGRKLIYDFSRGKNPDKQAHRFIPINYNIYIYYLYRYRFCRIVIKCNTPT